MAWELRTVEDVMPSPSDDTFSRQSLTFTIILQGVKGIVRTLNPDKGLNSIYKCIVYTFSIPSTRVKSFKAVWIW